MASITVKGMSCNHCKASVQETLSKLEGVEDVQVDLQSGKVDYKETSPVEVDTLRKAIEKIGFEVA